MGQTSSCWSLTHQTCSRTRHAAGCPASSSGGAGTLQRPGHQAGGRTSGVQYEALPGGVWPYSSLVGYEMVWVFWVNQGSISSADARSFSAGQMSRRVQNHVLEFVGLESYENCQCWYCLVWSNDITSARAKTAPAAKRKAKEIKTRISQ